MFQVECENEIEADENATSAIENNTQSDEAVQNNMVTSHNKSIEALQSNVESSESVSVSESLPDENNMGGLKEGHDGLNSEVSSQCDSTCGSVPNGHYAVGNGEQGQGTVQSCEEEVKDADLKADETGLENCVDDSGNDVESHGSCAMNIESHSQANTVSDEDLVESSCVIENGRREQSEENVEEGRNQGEWRSRLYGRERCH